MCTRFRFNSHSFNYTSCIRLASAIQLNATSTRQSAQLNFITVNKNTYLLTSSFSCLLQEEFITSFWQRLTQDPTNFRLVKASMALIIIMRSSCVLKMEVWVIPTCWQSINHGYMIRLTLTLRKSRHMNLRKSRSLM